MKTRGRAGGPVHTPREHRGRGYAAAAVAAVAEREQGLGHRVVLFTERANPTSNALYARLGLEAGTGTAMLALRPA